MLSAVTMKEINAIFEVTDRLGISREAIEIPLTPEHPGAVHALPNGRYEIIVESEIPLAEWLPVMGAKIKDLAGKTP